MGTKPCREKKPSLSHPESGGVTFSPQAALQGEGQIPPWAPSHPGQVWADFINSAPSRAGKQFSRVISSIIGPKSPVFLVGPAHSGCRQAGACGRGDSHGRDGGRLRLPLTLSPTSRPAPPRFRTRGHCPCSTRRGRTEHPQPPQTAPGACWQSAGHERGVSGHRPNFAMLQ